ncbi:N-acetylmuramoyl-L-alanine amidase [Brevibacterium sanguinis]|uniref:N-acetylmuramoyl-L-alanine amidase n=2 Tax=Brevibacterium TaxID=1696 RepID=A0A366IGL7_9MICO|nr:MULTISPECIES: N-acetylmuramoyl-L-alanine amidase [Brevibacterium]RBP64016.1 N-acetylmuramoyl-L-alanine amidase [Brevibacterium sanguinis]RBP70709.1 N-acetylmuramoyl-L-alanine amidase [Brevibacterium celere]
MSELRRPLAVLLCSILALAALGGCERPGREQSEPTPSASAPTPSAPAAAPKSSPTAEGADLSGRTVAIDPGHNGGNASHPRDIASPVPDGRGGTKACNTTGTATDSGFPEAEFTWKVSEVLAEELRAAGAEVIVSREDNDGVGPCVDERGTFADDADLLVSIHANGSESTTTRGFHVIVADPAVSEELEEPSSRLAEAIADSMGESFTPNRAYGDEAISRRSDLAGLNNASVPAVIVECGEMRNPEEAELMESAEGQRDYAAALFDGIVAWFAQSR